MKKSNGITLIALVITIIVLLILAGITIATLTGENGLLTRAEQAKTATETAGLEEQLKLEVLASIGEDGEINVTTLKTNLSTNLGATATGNSLPLSVSLGGQQYTIKPDGDVIQGGSTPSGSYGYNSSENCFIGQKSIYEGVEDNTQRANWDATKNGYRFTSGHFLHVTNYVGYLWDETTQTFVYRTGADVYLCWDDNYGTITSEQDLSDYAENNEITTSWDIFDASSGAWLYSDYTGTDSPQ